MQPSLMVSLGEDKGNNMARKYAYAGGSCNQFARTGL